MGFQSRLTLAAPRSFDWSGSAAVTTGSAAAGGGTATGDASSWFNLGIVHRLRIVANGNTTMANIEFFADASRTARLYFAEAVNAFTAAWDDGTPWTYRDADATSKLHYKITNNGANASTFTITIQGIGE